MVDFEATLRSSLAGYAIEREIGTGAMAVVFLAHDLKHDRNVAIKVLRPELTSAIGADRFNREIEVVAGLTHPHILPLHDSGDVDGLLYYVMPYIAAGSLRDRLARDGRLPIPDATRITREIADALGFAHRRGVIHRDVKPANILLAEDHALLADFGIAHLAETEGGTLTGTGLTLGTPTYFSPEQATGEHDIDGRSDIYSLGCVLYETLTGEPPFTGPSVQALIAHHIVDEPPRAKQLRPDVSDGIEAVVQTALRKEPERRFQTAGEMAGSLDLVSGGFEVMAARALRKLLGPRFRWLHGWRLAALVTAAVLVLVAAGLFLREQLKGPEYTGPPRYAILPFEDEQMSAEEIELSREAADELTWHLKGWKSISVVGGPEMEGPSLQFVQAGFELPTKSLSAGLSLLEDLDASHIVYVSANASGDSVELAAEIHRYDQWRRERLVQGEGSKSQIKVITADLALQILELHGEDATHDDLLRRSPHHTALQESYSGQAALWAWKLAEAEEYFRAAIAEDSAFAWAHHLLATTMFWRTIQDSERILDGASIAYHARQASDLGVGRRLRPGERKKVDAFLSFWDGDFETARSRYDSILEVDQTDLDALVLAGAVETLDRWLIEDGDGGLIPRRNLDRARAVFDSAVSLNSSRELAWGLLFDIDMQLAHTAYEGWCYGFLTPGGPFVVPYEFPEAAELRYFCPYAMDGRIRWLPDTIVAQDRERAREGLRELQSRSLDRIESWARVERYQPRPHEELAAWMLWERTLPGCDADPFESDSLLTSARWHTERALEIRGDTTPEDRVRFAALLLASGDPDGAIRHTDRALEELGFPEDVEGPVPPMAAANVYLVAGRGELAARIIEGVWNPGTYAVPDPEADGGWFPGGQVLGTRWALGGLGLSDGSDEAIVARFSVLDRTWREPQVTPRQQALARADALLPAGPALARFPRRWDPWFAGWDEYGLSVPVAWQGMRLADSDPAAARDLLIQAVAELEPTGEGRLNALHFHMPIELAQRLGQDSAVADLRRRLQGCPLRVTNIDLGWALK